MCTEVQKPATIYVNKRAEICNDCPIEKINIPWNEIVLRGNTNLRCAVCG